MHSRSIHQQLERKKKEAMVDFKLDVKGKTSFAGLPNGGRKGNMRCPSFVWFLVLGSIAFLVLIIAIFSSEGFVNNVLGVKILSIDDFANLENSLEEFKALNDLKELALQEAKVAADKVKEELTAQLAAADKVKEELTAQLAAEQNNAKEGYTKVDDVTKDKNILKELLVSVKDEVAKLSAAVEAGAKVE